MIIATVAVDVVAVTRLEILSEEETVTMIGTADAAAKEKNAGTEAEEITTAMMTVIAIKYLSIRCNCVPDHFFAICSYKLQ